MDIHVSRVREPNEGRKGGEKGVRNFNEECSFLQEGGGAILVGREDTRPEVSCDYQKREGASRMQELLQYTFQIRGKVRNSEIF